MEDRGLNKTGIAGLGGAITVVLAILKLAKIASVSWLTVFMPLIIGVVLTLLVAAIFVIVQIRKARR